MHENKLNCLLIIGSMQLLLISIGQMDDVSFLTSGGPPFFLTLKFELLRRLLRKQ